MSKNYKNVTKEWLKNATPNSHEVKEARYFKDKDGTKYYVDGKYVILDYNKKEKEIAEWLEETFGGEIYMLPRVNKPKGIKTADYLWNNELWDLKIINGNGKHTLDSSIKKKKSQSNNFIFDISNNKMPIENMIGQIETIFNSKNRKWIDKIMIIHNKELIIVYKQKRD